MDADFEAMRELAGAVVEQAMDDLGGAPGVASEAEHFLRVGFWDVEAPWSGLLRIRRDQLIAGIEKRKAELAAKARQKAAADAAREARWIRFSAA